MGGYGGMSSDFGGITGGGYNMGGMDMASMIAPMMQMPISAAAITGTGIDRRRRRLEPKMLGKLQALRLVVGADAAAVKRGGPCQHFFIDQPADDLAVL